MKSVLRKFFNVVSLFVLVMGLVVSTQLVKEVADIRGRASGSPANIVVDLGTSFADQKNSWEFLSQGGEERGRSLAPVVTPVKVLKPQYIRIDHVYDFFNVVSRDQNGKIVYNWTDFDAYIRDILATGAKPFLALSYTPAALGSKDTDMPDLSGWSQLVQATVEHVSGRRGLGIADVYYEVWNEPDLFGSFKVYPPKNYIDLYRASNTGAAAAKDVLPFKFGGPASTALYKNWFDALVQLAKNESVRFDFFSWHQYSSETDTLDQNIKDVLLWREQAALPNLELFVTENGMDSSNNPDYDGTKSAIHSLAVSALSVDKLNGLFHFEIKDGPGPSQYWGRWGLLTHEKFGVPVAKPRYQALAFLSSLSSGERVNTAGSGSWVKAFARVDVNSVRLFVVNFDPEDKHVEAVPIKFVGIPYPKFTMTRKDFNGQSTSLDITPINKEYQTVQYMKANSAAIFELVPQK